MTAMQLDLFGTVLSAEQQRHRDALVCLRDSMPDALEVVVDLRRTDPHDTRSPRAGGEWAYCVSRAGVRVERADEWWAGVDGGPSGWDRTPRHLVSWAELSDLIGADPRRAEVAAWVDTLPELRWRLLMRPHELWPNPGGWHIRYFCHDHVHEQWTARRRAWQLVLDLLDDAIATLGQGGDR